MKTEQIIYDLIKQNHTPVDFTEITTHLSSNTISPNKTTIYRNLEKLIDEGLIKKVILSDHKQYWEKTQSNSVHQHYHLICQKCNKIECKELEQNFQFELTNFLTQKTELNLFGLCQNCV